MRKVLFLIVSFLTITIYAGVNNLQQGLNNINKNFFIENKGQWPSEVKYLAKVGGMNAWITNSGVVYDYYKITKNYKRQQLDKLTPDKKADFEQKNTSINGHVVQMQLIGVNADAVSKEDNKQEGYYNYFIGKDKNKWASDVPLYGNLQINEIYPNINVKYYFDGNSIRYDYIVKSGADITKLKMKFNGQESIRVNEKGELVIKTSLGEVTNGKLYSYQSGNDNKIEVACKFKQNQDGSIGFDVKEYDRTKDLIIDPLIYSTFISGSEDDRIFSMSVDKAGDVYITGFTQSADYPVRWGAYSTTFSSVGVVVVTKLNSYGNMLVYSTFIGGSSGNCAYSIDTDVNGNAFITGQTNSNDYPITPGAFQTTCGGNSDAFITKLNASGSALIYSTFIGGSGSDWSNTIKVDTYGNAFLAGMTSSNNYPVTQGSFQTTKGNGTDAFITKLNSVGNGLIYSTFIGGDGFDRCNSIVIDTSGSAYITGQTNSNNYPTTQGAYKTTYNGGDYDTFISKLNSTGSALVYSTFIGGSSAEDGNSITIDADGNAYITGQTNSNNYPTTQGAYKTAYNGGNADTFISKLNSAGSSLVYSTFVGGNDLDVSTAIAIDTYRNAFITGLTASNDYPTTTGAFQATSNGSCNSFISMFNPTGSALTYSTYIGGSIYDCSTSIVLDANRYVYISGYTESNNYPTTPGAYRTTHSSTEMDNDGFITKIDVLPLRLTSPIGNEVWLEGSAHYITWNCIVAVSTVKLEYTTDNGANWNYITTSASASGRYLWSIPNISSELCKVRITLLDSTNISDVSTVFFTIRLKALKITTPNGGENWERGSWKTIKWTGNFTTNIKIEYSIDNGSNWAAIIDSIPSSKNQYRWKVPDTLSTYCKIKITSLDNIRILDISDSTFSISSGTSVDDNNLIPISNNLSYNYPNPFNPVTNISYSVAQEANVVIRVYDILGKEVTKLVNENKKAGMYCVQFKAANLASGMYFYTIQMMSIDGKESYRATKKMLLLK